jgi:insecticidal toxin complex protein TccC
MRIGDRFRRDFAAIATRNGFYGQLPQKIIRRCVQNRITLSKTEGLTGDHLMQVFLNETPNGKSTARILDVFGLKARSVEIQNLPFSDDPDFIINLR